MQKNTASKIIYLLAILLVMAMGFGCAPKSRGLSDSTAEGYGGYGAGSEKGSSSVDKRVRDYLAAEKNDPRGQDVLIRTAKTALGTPYVRGGTSTDGFDCSGFVQWTFNQVGVKLPRTAREQSRVGQLIRNVDDMEVGDIVAFHHPKRGYHTGIYVGDGKFIHSPRKRTRVRINSMDDPYFSKTFLGARRIGVSSPEDIEAAENMLAEYREKEMRRARTKDSGKSSKQVASANKRGKKESASSTRARQGKDSGNAGKNSGGKAASSEKKGKSNKNSVGQAPPAASQKAVAKAEGSSKQSSRASRASSAEKQRNTSEGKRSTRPTAGKTSSKSGSEKNANTKRATASQNGSSQKKGS